MKRGMTAETVQVVLARASRDGHPCCEVCGGPLLGERGYHWSIHHRRGRDGLPDSHTAPNALLVHGASNVDLCHGRIHGGRVEAEANGWWLSRLAGVDPLTVPVVLHDRTVYFTADGSYSDNLPGDDRG